MEHVRIQFLYRRGDVVGYGPTQTKCTILWQRYQTREVLGPLISYYVETAEGRTCWVSEADLSPVPRRD